MKYDRLRADAIIVGGGFSGTMMAAQLARRGLSALLIEGAGRAGRGTAYSTREAAHLLNVPAAKMSAWADDGDDFVSAGYDPGTFVPRRDFGAYLRGILNQATADGKVGIIDAWAVRAERDEGGWSVSLDDATAVHGPQLILAQGNQPPAMFRPAANLSVERFANNPWSDEARGAVAKVAATGGDVLILGTGLTMIDMVLSLDEAGHRGRIVALSRRGQFPRAHAAHEPAPVVCDEVPLGNVLSLWRWLRRRGTTVGWRAAVDSLRPHSHAIWRSLDAVQQRRFLVHARPWWDVHRHRIAPEIAERLHQIIAEGRLEIVAGRVERMIEDDAGLAVTVRRRGNEGATETERFAVAFNCTGPLGEMARTRDPLLRQMIDDGLIAVDRLGMGLQVDSEGRAGADLWALGPLTKGALWEIVAVPDIRGQVAHVADAIAKEHRS